MYQISHQPNANMRGTKSSQPKDNPRDNIIRRETEKKKDKFHKPKIWHNTLF